MAIGDKLYIADKPTQNLIKTNTDSILSDTTTLKNSTSTITDDIATLKTNSTEIKNELTTVKNYTDTVEANVGSNNDASSPYGSVHSKLKDIKANLGGSSIKSIQRGTYSMGSSTSGNVTISSIEPSKSVLIVDSTIDNKDYTNGVIISSLSRTSISFLRGNGFGNMNISWQVIEYQ